MGKKEKTLTVILSAIVMLVLTTVTYGFFSAGVNNDNRQEASITTGDMKLTFADGNAGFSKALGIGESATKTFKIENTGTLTATATLYWLDFVNTYTLGTLTYTLEYSTEENGTYTILQENVNVPKSENVSKVILQNGITIPKEVTYYYRLTITLNNLEDVNQNADLNAVMNTKFTLDANDSRTESEKTLAALGLTANTGTPDFSQVATTDEGIFATEDDDGTSYYFRGAVTNNKVKFGKYSNNIYTNINLQTDAPLFFYDKDKCETSDGNYTPVGNECSVYIPSNSDMYWRIIRINGDGSLRLIYDGVIEENETIGKIFSTDYSEYSDISSVQDWYSYNISGTIYDDVVTESNFCIDNTYYIDDVCANENSDDLEYVEEYCPFYYGGYYRVVTNKSPSLECKRTNDNLYGTMTKLTGSKVSEITVDEVALAGGVFRQQNSNYYLNKDSFYYRTSSYAYFEEGHGALYGFSVGEKMSLFDFDDELIYFAPVINLSAEYARTLKLDANGVYVAE